MQTFKDCSPTQNMHTCPESADSILPMLTFRVLEMQSIGVRAGCRGVCRAGTWSRSGNLFFPNRLPLSAIWAMLSEMPAVSEESRSCAS